MEGMSYMRCYSSKLHARGAKLPDMQVSPWQAGLACHIHAWCMAYVIVAEGMSYTMVQYCTNIATI